MKFDPDAAEGERMIVVPEVSVFEQFDEQFIAPGVPVIVPLPLPAKEILS